MDFYNAEVIRLLNKVIAKAEEVYSNDIADFDEFERGNCYVITPFREGIPDSGGRITEADGSTRPPANEEEAFSPDFCDRSGGRLGSNPEDFLALGARQDFNISDSISGYGLLEYSYTGDSCPNATAFLKTFIRWSTFCEKYQPEHCELAALIIREVATWVTEMSMRTVFLSMNVIWPSTMR